MSAGTLIFSGNGSATQSAAMVASGILRLDNMGVAMGDRLSDSNAFSLGSGRFEVLGNASTAVEQFLGLLRFSGSAKISVIQPGAAATSTALPAGQLTAAPALSRPEGCEPLEL